MNTIFQNLGAAAILLTVIGSLACPASAQGRSDMRWSGDVDDTTIVSIRGNDVRTDTVFGKQASNINAQVFGSLPRGPIQAYLVDRRGRGQVRIVQQPNPDNDFTAKVRIHDPQAGRAHYDFDLAWVPLGPPPGGGYFMRPPLRFNGQHGF
ncbi:MAG: hypothetical protein ACRYFS_03275 [Janthinobacterium lividum]